MEEEVEEQQHREVGVREALKLLFQLFVVSFCCSCGSHVMLLEMSNSKAAGSNNCKNRKHLKIEIKRWAPPTQQQQQQQQ